MKNKTITVPVCQKHKKYLGKRCPRTMCQPCGAIWLLKNQDELCACEFDATKECDREASLGDGELVELVHEVAR